MPIVRNARLLKQLNVRICNPDGGRGLFHPGNGLSPAAIAVRARLALDSKAPVSGLTHGKHGPRAEYRTRLLCDTTAAIGSSCRFTYRRSRTSKLTSIWLLNLRTSRISGSVARAEANSFAISLLAPPYKLASASCFWRRLAHRVSDMSERLQAKPLPSLKTWRSNRKCPSSWAVLNRARRVPPLAWPRCRCRAAASRTGSGIPARSIRSRSKVLGFPFRFLYKR